MKSNTAKHLSPSVAPTYFGVSPRDTGWEFPHTPHCECGVIAPTAVGGAVSPTLICRNRRTVSNIDEADSAVDASALSRDEWLCVSQR